MARCKFYNLGCCKFKIKDCKFEHPKEVCQSYYYKTCQKRHPRKRRYENKYKFGKECENKKLQSGNVNKPNNKNKIEE